MKLRRMSLFNTAFVLSVVLSLIVTPASSFVAADLTPEIVSASELRADIRSNAAAQYSMTTDREALGAINASEFGLRQGVKNQSVQLTAAAIVPAVAMITIFTDPTASLVGSSGGFTIDAGTHAFITIRNVSISNINVGKFSGIAPNGTMSLGTWGASAQPLHNGLWYNLESYKVSINGFYKGRISVSYLMTATQLSTLNSFIVSNDVWGTTSNCSSFASGAWNSIVETAYKISAGVPNTPKNLANNIKSKFPSNYKTALAVPYNYAVYFANGTGAPTQTNSFK